MSAKIAAHRSTPVIARQDGVPAATNPIQPGYQEKKFFGSFFQKRTPFFSENH
jgi:hypothetical protein